MTDLTREQIEKWHSAADGNVCEKPCDMALRTHDAEEECERLREELKSEQGRTAWWRNRAATNLERTDAPHTPEQTAEYGEITESDGDMGLPGMRKRRISLVARMTPRSTGMRWRRLARFTDGGDA